MDRAIVSSALREVLRFSLEETPASPILKFDSTIDATTAGRPPINDKDPRIKKLLEQILFSRRFILTYFPVLASVLFIFTTIHQAKEFQRRRRRWASKSLPHDARIEEEHEESGNSSSSSTLEGTASPPDESLKGTTTRDEHSSLLGGGPSTKPFNPSIRYHLRGWLMYQPPDIPSCNVKFPSNATSLLILAFIGLNAFYLFFHLPLSIPMLFAFADRAGLVFVANLPILYLLSSKNQPLKWLTGSSYESLNIFHRRLGELMVFLGFLHTVGMFGVWYTLLQPFGLSLSRFLANRVILLGIFTFLAYQTIYMTSTALFRQQWYEIFLGLHVILQAAALILLWFHHRNSRVYVAVALAIFCIDRLIIRMTLRTKSIRASLKIMEDGQTVQISSDRVVEEDRGLLTRIVRPDISGGWNATDHVFLTVPSLSRKHVIQAHPFTIASRASENRRSCFKLLVRSQDGFSKDLLRYAKGHDSVVTRIDGPYGAQSPVSFLQDKELAIVVAGGSGIAVALPLIWSLIKAANDPELGAVSSSPRKVLFVWIIHNKKHITWVDPQDLSGLSDRGVKVLSYLGRQDIDEIIQSWLLTEGRTISTKIPSVGVVVSGPDGMNRDVRNSCAAMAHSGYNIAVEVEKYGW